MAVTIIDQPGALALARSAMSYLLHEPTAELGDYLYELQVFVWDGLLTAIPTTPTATLRRKAGLDTYARFDISGIVRNFLTNLDYNLPLQTTGNLATNVMCKAYYFDGSALQGEVTTTTIQAQSGYNYYTQPVNNLIAEEKDGILTDLPYVHLTDKGYFSVFMRHTTRSLADSIAVQNEAGLGVSLPITVASPPTSSEETLIKFNVGPADLAISEPAFNLGQRYKVFAKNGLTVHGKTLWFDQLCYPQDVNQMKVDYINKYGVWDRIYMYGNYSESMQVTKTDAMHQVQYNPSNDQWKQSEGQFVVYNKMGRDSITLNTGWVEETYREPLKQLFLSERAVVDGHAAVLQPTSITYQTKRLEKMINYSLTFDMAFETINTVH